MSNVSMNSTATSALALLTGTEIKVDKTAIKVASGKAVNTAADNAAYWSIATKMSSDSVAMSSAQDATGLAAATVDTASLGIAAATDIASDIQSKLILAKAVGSDKTAINSEITQLKSQLVTIAQSTSFSGQNWLSTDAGQSPQVSSMVASVTNSPDGTLSVNTIEYDTSASVLTAGGNAGDGSLTKSYSGTTADGTPYSYFLLNVNSSVAASGSEIAISSTTSDSELDGMIAATDSIMSSLTNAGASLGATSKAIADSSSFLKDLQDTLDIGVGKLVDANLEELSTKMAAEKAQQQLQIIGLNIANHQPQLAQSLYL